MGTIKKIDTVLGAVYERYDSNNELIQRAGAIGFSKEYKGKVYYVITDLNGNRLKDANRFLNQTLAKAGYKKRESAFTALKIFYSFISLFHITNYEKGLDNETLQQLQTFLKGGTHSGNSLDYDLKVERKNSTIRPYITIYRQFYQFIFNVRNSPLHDRTSVYINEHENGVHKVDKFNSNPQSPKLEQPPKYIKYDEYQSILKIIDDKYFLRDKIIVMLMFESGLRLGEVLGITIEDIYFEFDTSLLSGVGAFAARLTFYPGYRYNKTK